MSSQEKFFCISCFKTKSSSSRDPKEKEACLDCAKKVKSFEEGKEKCSICSKKTSTNGSCFLLNPKLFPKASNFFSDFIQKKRGELESDSWVVFCKVCLEEMMKEIEKDGLKLLFEEEREKAFEKLKEEDPVAREYFEKQEKNHKKFEKKEELVKENRQKEKAQNNSTTSETNSSSSQDKNNTIYWVLGGIGLVTVIGGVAFLLSKKNKKKEE